MSAERWSWMTSVRPLGRLSRTSVGGPPAGGAVCATAAQPDTTMASAAATPMRFQGLIIARNPAQRPPARHIRPWSYPSDHPALCVTPTGVAPTQATSRPTGDPPASARAPAGVGSWHDSGQFDDLARSQHGGLER